MSESGCDDSGLAVWPSGLLKWMGYGAKFPVRVPTVRVAGL